MPNLEEAIKIVKEYFEKVGYSNFKISNVLDKIYKWEIEAESSLVKFKIEISKLEGDILKFDIF